MATSVWQRSHSSNTVYENVLVRTFEPSNLNVYYMRGSRGGGSGGPDPPWNLQSLTGNEKISNFSYLCTSTVIRQGWNPPEKIFWICACIIKDFFINFIRWQTEWLHKITRYLGHTSLFIFKLHMTRIFLF